MKAFLLKRQCDLTVEQHPLDLSEIEPPVPQENEILIRVSCCGVCHTEIDEIEGRTPPKNYPVIPGHQVVGVVSGCGSQARKFKAGDRVGVAWIFAACGSCEFCLKGFENLCVNFQATGRDANGGYAEFMTIDEQFAYVIPEVFTNEQAAPLLCAGAIGYRSLKLTSIVNGQALGLCGFGGSGHLVLKLARAIYPDSPVLVFARSVEEQAFARSLGAFWAGQLSDHAPLLLNAMIDTTPAWYPVVQSMAHIKPGGRLVINAIRKESKDVNSLLSLSYSDHLWMEREIKSVANITRQDVNEFLQEAARASLFPEVQTYSFIEANRALWELKNHPIRGSKVLVL